MDLQKKIEEPGNLTPAGNLHIQKPNIKFDPLNDFFK